MPLRLVWMFTNVGMRAFDVDITDDMCAYAPHVGIRHMNVGVPNVSRAAGAWIAHVLCALCVCSFVVMTVVATP